MRLVFMGTPDFSVPALVALHKAGHDIACVYTQPPRPAGRGKKNRPSAVHQTAEALGLDVRYPVSLKSEDSQADFHALGAEIAVVVAYGLILPQPILQAPDFGCLNIHASLLPRWRGAAPIHRAIMAGDRETGVCIMQMEAGLDTGPVLLRGKVPIGAEETTSQLHDHLAKMGAGLICEALDCLADLVAEEQPETGVTYAKKIEKAEAKLDWTLPASELDWKIRGLSRFPGAWFEHQGQRVKVLGSTLNETRQSTAKPGTVLDHTLNVACGEGVVTLTRLQRAGKAVQSSADFLRGSYLPPGTVLGD